MNINICRDFSETPGSRHKTEGKYSGEEFRENMLEPKYLESKKAREMLVIDLDGGYGYPTSFLEEAFGGLARKYGSKDILATLKFVSEDEPSLIDEIIGYIRQAKKEAD